MIRDEPRSSNYELISYLAKAGIVDPLPKRMLVWEEYPGCFRFKGILAVLSLLGRILFAKSSYDVSYV